MGGSIGEKIGEGAMADIHAWAPGQVLKLFKAGVSHQIGAQEAQMTRDVFAVGGPAPEVFAEVTLEGRFGIVLPRLDGPTLLQLMLARAMTSEQAGAILAALFITVHNTPPPPEAPSLHDWFDSASRLHDGIPGPIAAGILAMIERLPAADGLCHADLHPGNVIMTANGPRLIDWACAVRAPAAFDLGRCHVTFTELVDAPEGVDPEAPRAFNAAVQVEYARLASLSDAALTAAMAPYLTILRAFALIERPASARRDLLIERIEASLRSEGLWAPNRQDQI